MKTLLIPAALLVAVSGAHAQSGGLPGTAPGSASAPTAGAMDPTTVKPKGQIIMVSKPGERRTAGVRAHCSNGTVYWLPRLQEGVNYCVAEDAPTPNK